VADERAPDIGRWQRLNSLLDEALALDPPERERWLTTLPAAYDDLLPTLRNMLVQRQVETHAFLSRPVAVDELLAQAGAAADEAPGQQIGPYCLLRPLGSGGMGSVWLAERSDGALTRTVAVKLPRQGWSPGLVERMRRERDILASLEHPLIARLYDAGTTVEGRPYLAMEYVDGRAIDQYCRETHASTRERLQLFLQVAEAVAYAHGRLIVHRDLKPNNILVTADAQVRLLDFGVATLLRDVDGPDAVPGLTRIGGTALTLDYASPEQVRGETVTVASDVYTLGVVLFELITGQRPYKLRRDSAAALEEAIAEQDIPLASSRVDKALRKQVRGDLDAIIAKAMKKWPDERYSSVEGFANDIRRLLNNEPVTAQRDSRWYRASKFVRRNAGGVAASAAVFAAVLIGGGVAVWQADVARKESARSAASKRFIASIFTDATPKTGSGGAVTASDLLQAALPRLDTEFANDPAVAGELGIMIGEAFDRLGEVSKVEAPLRKAIPLAESALGREHPVTLRGKVVLASVVVNHDIKEALAIADSAVPGLRKGLPESADVLMAALQEQSFARAKFNQPEPSYAPLIEAIEIGERHLGRNNDQTLYLMGLLSNTYARFQERERGLQVAEEAYRRAQSSIAAQRPGVRLTAIERWYADALVFNGRPGDAIPIFRQVLIDQQKLDVVPTVRVRSAKATLARALAVAGHVAEAIPLQEQAVALEREQNVGESDDRVNFVRQLGQWYAAARRSGDALSQYAHADEISTRLPPVDVGRRLNQQLDTVRAHLLNGDFAAVDEALDAIKPDTPGASPATLNRANVLRAASLRLRGDATRALDILQNRLNTQTELSKFAAPRAGIQSELAMAFVDSGDLKQAETAANACRQLFATAQIRLGVATHECLIASAVVRLRAGDALEAEKLLTALAMDWSLTHAGSVWHGEAQYWLAKAMAANGKAKQAADTDALARIALRESRMPVHQRLR